MGAGASIPEEAKGWTEEDAKTAGYTDEQIAAYRAEHKRTGVPISEQITREKASAKAKTAAPAEKAAAATPAKIPKGAVPSSSKAKVGQAAAPKAKAAAVTKAAPAEKTVKGATPATATKATKQVAEPQPEPEPAAPTTGKGTPKTFQMNRNSVLKQYLLAAGWRAATKSERAQLAHWDAHSKNGPANAEIDCFPRSATNCIDNIWTFYKRVERIGMAKDGFPETFFDWRQLDRATIDSSTIWFLKNVFGVHGNGIRLIGSWEEYQAALKDVPQKPSFMYGPSGQKETIDESHYLQRGLVRCHLYDGRKYLLRVYYLALGDGRVCVYDDALGYAHGKPFDPMEKTWSVHVSHVNVPGKDEKPKPDDRIYFNLSTMERGAEVMEKIMAHSKRHVKLIQETITGSQDHPKPQNRYDISILFILRQLPPCGTIHPKTTVGCLHLLDVHLKAEGKFVRESQSQSKIVSLSLVGS